MNASDHQILDAVDAPEGDSAGGDLAVDAPRVRRSLPEDNHNVATLSSLTELVDAYLPESDQQRVRDAFKFGDNAHLGQVRSSGAPYISHPIAVAEICAGWKLDAESIMAALLHDTVEDTEITKENILEHFGSNVADLVDGLSKLDRVRFATKEHQQAESFRKMLLAMATDARVILIKLADRLHNMRTIDALKPEKRRRVATETLEVYAPIASRLGLYQVYRELLDRSFKAAYPRRFDVLSRAVKAARGNRRDAINQVFRKVSEALPAAGIKAEIFAREKAIYSIYQKMRNKKLPFSKVYDVYGVRIIVDEVMDCYRALGALHMTLKPMPGRFKDYIALGKENGYQSLHTSLLGPSNIPIEFQIRTHEMQRIAESGVAAHWLYKSDGEEFSDLSRLAHNWLQTLLDIQSTTGDGIEFMDHVKVDLFPDEVYVFTPAGDIRALPRNATVLDYAYAVHTDIGNKAVGGRINGATARLNDELSSGDVVEVITDEHATPRPVWLNWVRSGRARSEIRHYLKTMRYEESVELGRRLMESALAGLGLGPDEVEPEHIEKAARDSGAANPEALYADIGIGKRLANLEARAVALTVSGKPVAASVMPRLRPLFVSGDERSAITYASCCHPIPDDKVIGHLRGGHGLVLHRSGCKTANRQRDRDPDHFIDVRWASDLKSDFRAYVEMESTSGPGTLGIIAAEISAAGANIVDVHIDEDDESGKLRIGVHIKDRAHLARLMRALRKLDQVKSVQRG